MAKRYPFSSYSDEAMDNVTTDGRQLDQNGVTTGRVKWLRGIMITENGGAADTLNIYDYNTEGADPTAALQRAAIYVGANSTVVVDFPAPGLKFVTGIIGGLVSDTATIPAYGIAVWGYEE